MRKLGIAAALIVLQASPARAETEEQNQPPARERQLAFVLQAGPGSPVGLYGGAVELAPVPWLLFGAGAGGNADGAQIAVMMRARMPERGVGAGIGVSVGPFSHSSNGTSFELFPREATTRWQWDRAAWLNVELLSIETASTNVIRARFFAGLAFLLNRTPTRCTQGRANPSAFFGPSSDGPPCSDIPGTFLYIGAAIGPGIALW